MSRLPPVAAAIAVLLMVLAGCSQAKDAATGAADSAACALAKKAVDGVRGQANDAIAKIGTNPADAKQQLTDARNAVRAAEGQVGGDTLAKVTQARQALDRLVTQADAAAAGTRVDTSAVDAARAQLTRAVDDLDGLC